MRLQVFEIGWADTRAIALRNRASLAVRSMKRESKTMAFLGLAAVLRTLVYCVAIAAQQKSVYADASLASTSRVKEGRPSPSYPGNFDFCQASPHEDEVAVKHFVKCSKNQTSKRMLQDDGVPGHRGGVLLGTIFCLWPETLRIGTIAFRRELSYAFGGTLRSR